MRNKKIFYLLPVFIFSIVCIYLVVNLNSNINAHLNSTSLPNSDFFNKYLNNSIEITKSFPLNSSSYLENYNNYDFLINRSIPVEIILVDASNFSKSEDLYKEFYMSSSGTGNFIKAYNYSDSDISLDMAVVEPAVGAKTYMLIGSAINSNKGYYFQVYLGDVLANKLTESEIDSAVKFYSLHNPKEVLDLIKGFYKEDLSKGYFKNFITNTDKHFSDLPQGNFEMPVVQDRD